MYLPGVPEIAAAFRSEANQVALSVPSYLVGVLFGQLVHGFFSDRYGRKPPLYAGLLIYCASSFACACVDRAHWFLALRFIQGFGGSVGTVIARAMIHDRTDARETARAFSLLILATSVAPLLAPLLGTALMQVGGWRATFVSMGVFGGILLALCLALPETLERSRRTRIGVTHQFRCWGRILGDRQFVTWTLSNGLLQGGMYAYVSMSAIVLIGAYGQSSGVFSAMVSLGSLGMVIAAQMNARLVRRVELRSIVKWALRVSVGSMVALAGVSGNPPAVILFAAIFIYLSMIGFVAPNSAAIALARHAERAGSASALLGTLLFGMGAACGSIAAHIMPDVPTRALILVMTACSVLAMLVFCGTPDDQGQWQH